MIRSADPDKALSLKREYLESIFPLKKGDIFAIGKIRKAIENYNKLTASTASSISLPTRFRMSTTTPKSSI